FEPLPRGLQVTMPCFGFVRWKLDVRKAPSQVTAGTRLLVVRHKPCNGGAIPEQHERDVLIMRAVRAVGEIAGGFSDADFQLFHNIRLSNYHIIRSSRKTRA